MTFEADAANGTWTRLVLFSSPTDVWQGITAQVGAGQVGKQVVGCAGFQASTKMFSTLACTPQPCLHFRMVSLIQPLLLRHAT